MTGGVSERIRLPTLPEGSDKPGFPLLATAAPVAGSLVMWMLTQSPYALLFALLGPLVALGALVDSRRRQRKANRAARDRYEAERAAARGRIDAEHARERREIQRAVLGALDIVTREHPTHERWRREPAVPPMVSLGTGTIPSTLTVDGDASDALTERAARLTDAPVLADASGGIAVVGAGAAAIAMLRALVLQLAHVLNPERVALHIAVGDEGRHESELEWLRALPHTTETAPPESRHGALGHATVRFTDRTTSAHAGTGASAIATVALVGDDRELPRDCRVAVQPEGARLHLLRWPHPDSAPTDVRPHLLTGASARRLAAELHSAAVADGLLDDSTVPDRVSASELGEQPAASSRTLACVFGLGASRAPLVVDLVADGPHALVGGTTGSGKSELLCAWIHALATAHTPHQLNALLVDFKGGASFHTVAGLPHIVGHITDLDGAEALRALESLKAELRHRERVLAALGARDVSELPPFTLPRLVIVVDEYAALVTEHQELHAVFADIAARGRSLGLHLILSTQRPAGIVREAILANMPLRVSLRVLDPADSTAVIGSPDAAHLTGAQPGRALITSVGRGVTPVQPALVTIEDAAAVRTRHGDPESFSPRRPWLPPLPSTVTMDDLRAAEHSESTERETSTGIPFAVIDRPSEQRRAVARLDLAVSGSLLIVGARGSGRSSTITTLAECAEESGLQSRLLPGDIEGLWDGVHDALAQVRRGARTPVLLLADDIDVTLSRTGEEHRDALTRALVSLLTEGPARGVTLALSVTRVGASTASLAAHCDARIVLRTADQSDHHAAGADPRRFTPDLPPGRGWYRGELVQVAVPSIPSRELREGERGATEVLPRTTSAIVTPRATELVERLNRAWGQGSAVHVEAREPTDAAQGPVTVTADDKPPVLVADPEAWQSRLGLFSQLSRTSSIAYHDCTLAQYRALSSTRSLPPPLERPAHTVWLAHPSAETARARLPGG